MLVDGLNLNLLSISQLCDSEYNVIFNKGHCKVLDGTCLLVFNTNRQGNLYEINLDELHAQSVSCLISIEDEAISWHNKYGHANMRLISKLQCYHLMRGLHERVT